jgi:hypothetical protein
MPRLLRMIGELASLLPLYAVMLKLLGSYAIARLLGFGLLGAVVIYGLISLFS